MHICNSFRFLISISVPNWASAEAQFIPNFSLATPQIFQIFSNFPMHTSVWHCVAAPPLATGWPRSRSFLTARVASVKQIVIIIIKLVIIIHWGQKKQISRNLLKTMSNFFFCQAQLGINVYYREKKLKNKNLNWHWSCSKKVENPEKSKNHFF